MSCTWGGVDPCSSTDWLEGSSAKKNFGILMDTTAVPESAVCPWGKQPNRILGFLCKREANRSREAFFFLYSALLRWRTGTSMSMSFTVSAVKYRSRLPRGLVDSTLADIQNLTEQDSRPPDPTIPILSRDLDHIRGPFQPMRTYGSVMLLFLISSHRQHCTEVPVLPAGLSWFLPHQGCQCCAASCGGRRSYNDWVKQKC